MRRGDLHPLAIDGPEPPLHAFTKPGRLFQHCVENRRQVTGRRIDDLQYLGGRGLLLERFARLGQEPRILDCYDGLRREILQQRDIPFRERSCLSTSRRNLSEHLVAFAQWHK
jgi:hypothetical protein